MRKLKVYLVFLFLVGCTLFYPNVEICTDGGRFGAFCKYTRSSIQRSLTKPQWDVYRVGQFGISPDGFGKYQRFIADQCTIGKNCKDEPPQPPTKQSGKLKIQSISTVTIPNVEICADEGDLGAFCKFTRSSVTRTIPKAQWDIMRAGWFFFTPDSLGEYQTFVSSSCNLNKNCIDATASVSRTLQILKRGSPQMKIRNQRSRPFANAWDRPNFRNR